MANLLNGKVALVTAGSAGLGAAVARALASESMRIVINYSANHDRANGLLESLSDEFSNRPFNATGKRFFAIQADLEKKADIVGLVDETVKAMDRRIVHHHGFFSRCQAKWKFPRETLIYTVVVLSSLISFYQAYAVTKAAQIHLVKSLATIVSPRIRVNSVAPAILLTDWGRQFSEEKLAAATEKTQLKRLPTVEDVADQIVLFAKSRSVTGTNAVIDCGFSL
ncbi:hypothetical protein P7C71_g4303, partial [Lecanoromycetidae sp. Uapishka_2]